MPGPTAEAARPQVQQGPGRRAERKAQPAKRSRRGRAADADGWHDTDWDMVSDEDYWAAVSADKPLAARTAGSSAVDSRAGDHEPAKRADRRTDPDPAPARAARGAGGRRTASSRPEPVAAPVGAPHVSGTERARAGLDSLHPGIGYVAPEYADPNLAVLASLSEPALDRRAVGQGPSPAVLGSPTDPAAGWTGAGPDHGSWPQRGQDYVAGDQASRPAVPPDAYGSQAYEFDQQTAGYTRGTPEHSRPTNPNFVSPSTYDNPLNGAGGPPAVSYGTYGQPDQGAGQFGGYSEPGAAYESQYGTAAGGVGTGPNSTAAYGTGPHGAGSYGTSSYGTNGYDSGSYGPPEPSSYGRESYASGSYGTDGYRTEAYDTSGYGTSNSSGPHRAPAPAPDAWGPPAAAPETGVPFRGAVPPGQQGRAGNDAARGTQPHMPSSAAPTAGYPAAVGGYPESFTPPSPGGRSRPGTAGPVNDYPSQPSGGFASGYLSSSALSARNGRPEPEPLASPGSANPYGSYVTGPGPSAEDAANGPDVPRQPRPADRADYDRRGAHRGYGDYGGGSRR